MKLVVDVSVFIDYFVKARGREARHWKARAFIDRVSSLGLVLYEPFLFEIELKGVLVRRIEPRKVVEIVNKVLRYINVVDEEELHNAAAQIALNTGCRAIDAYYIATAMTTSSILVTNDKIMRDSARRTCVEVYYLIEDYYKLMSKLATIMGSES